MTNDPRPRVMVVDDESFMLRLVAQMLANLGLQDVQTFDSGRAALQHLAGDPRAVDLVLCDLNMPGMDGIELMRRLREGGFRGGLVLISGEDERSLQATQQLARAHDIEFLGALRKPFSPQALERLLARWSPPPMVLRASDPRSPRRSYTADEVREGLSRGEFCNHYQPQVRVDTGAVVGMECLVRWQHPVQGLVMPGSFVGVCEENGLINDLTRVVLDDALRQAHAWQQAGCPLRVSVNISMETLAQLDFADFVAALAERAGVPAQRIVLEITESRLLRDLRAPLEVLMRLRLRRFGLSIDDFGTGHSSLAQLRDLPFDELKIDQGFVHGAGRDATLRAIHEASLGLARQLGQLVVAEGVEDLEDWELLRVTGCPVAQGYFIARPMPAQEVLPWCTGWAARFGRELRVAD